MAKEDFKCGYCKKLFLSMEEGIKHHNESRHKNKEIQIIRVESGSKKKTIENFEDDLESDSDEAPLFPPIKRNSRRKKVSTDDSDFGDPEIEEVKKPKRSRKQPTNRFKNKYIVVDSDDDEPSTLKRGRKPVYKNSASAHDRPPVIVSSKKDEPKISNIAPQKNDEPFVPELYYKCSKCEEWFPTFKDLQIHQSTMYDDDSMVPIISDEEGGAVLSMSCLTKYFCYICSLEAFSLKEIIFHWREHPLSIIIDKPFKYFQIRPNSTLEVKEEPTYKCSKCSLIPDVLEVLTKHWNDEHGPEIVRVLRLYDEASDLFKCHICGKDFPYNDMRTIHLKEEH